MKAAGWIFLWAVIGILLDSAATSDYNRQSRKETRAFGVRYDLLMPLLKIVQSSASICKVLVILGCLLVSSTPLYSAAKTTPSSTIVYLNSSSRLTSDVWCAENLWTPRNNAKTLCREGAHFYPLPCCAVAAMYLPMLFSSSSLYVAGGM